LHAGLHNGYYAVSPNLSGLRARARVRNSENQMNIGETIRNFRMQKGMSQGDIEKRTGLLRCYLSRVENGHTVPSLDTLAKIASSLEIPLGNFFTDNTTEAGKNLPQLSEEEVRFLSQIRRYSSNLNDSDRKLVLAMVKKMAVTTGR
jgi:transcriptional regulator with XRE-family HTH domain